MFSVNNFYDYLKHLYSWPEKSNNLVYTLENHDSRNLSKFSARYEFYRPPTAPTINEDKLIPEDIVLGGLFAFDDEPIFFDSYYTLYKFFPSNKENFTFCIAKMYPSIILHDETNSKEIDLLKEEGFLEARYWYHALISRDWFRHWKHYQPSNSDNKKRFGLYARDAAGTRAYRLGLFKQLAPISNQVYFQWQAEIKSQIKSDYIKQQWNDSPKIYSSDASAHIEWGDTGKFSIQIVAETLFAVDKIHLTEKVFKPIVMQQPFLLAALPNSLRFIRSYGFETFHELWDETYDETLDHKERLCKITEIVHRLNNLNTGQFNSLLEKSRKIVEHNHKHFYSQKFEDVLINEMKTNIETAISVQPELFNRDPGGLYFKYVNRLYQQNLDFVKENDRQIKHYLADIMRYVTANFSDHIVKKLVKDYGHLF